MAFAARLNEWTLPDALPVDLHLPELSDIDPVILRTVFTHASRYWRSSMGDQSRDGACRGHHGLGEAGANR